MKKDIKEILSGITPETPFEEVLAYCDTTEDFELIMKSVSATESNSYTLTDEMKRRAGRLARLVQGINEDFGGNVEISTSYIQNHLHVPYPQAAAIYDWLKNKAHI